MYTSIAGTLERFSISALYMYIVHCTYIYTGRLAQLDGDMEDGNENDEEEDEEGIAEDGSENKSELELVKEILDNYIKSLEQETLVNQPVKEVSDLKVALSNILKKLLMSKNCL